MQAIDVHAHFAPVSRFREMRAIAPDHVPVVEHVDDVVFFRYPSGIENGPVPKAIVDIEQRLIEMAATEVTHQVLSARPQMFSYDLPGEVAGALAFLVERCPRRRRQRVSRVIQRAHCVATTRC